MDKREENLNEDVQVAETADILTGTGLDGIAATIEDLTLRDTKSVYNALNRALDKGGLPVEVSSQKELED